MRIFFILFMFCFFVYGAESASARNPLKGVGSAVRVPIPKTPKTPKIGISVPKTPKTPTHKIPVSTHQIPLAWLSVTRFTNSQLAGLREHFVPMSKEKFEQLLTRSQLSRKEALEIQQQIFYGEWTEEAQKMLLLKELPSLPLLHGLAPVPSFQQQAVKLYQQLVNDYTGSSSFSGNGDFDSWGKTLAAVSNLGLFGSQKDASALINVYQQVPAPAKQVTAVAIMRALLSLNMPEELASFAQMAAKDGVLTEEFSLGVDNNADALIRPSAQELELMRQSALRFQPVNALHFDFSAEATTRWMDYKKAVQMASPSLDLSGFSSWQERNMRGITPDVLKEMLSGENSPIFKGMNERTVQHLVTLAKMEWARRFVRDNTALAAGIPLEKLAQWADYTRYENPVEALKDWLADPQNNEVVFLTNKKEEYNLFLDKCFQMPNETFSQVYAEFQRSVQTSPNQDWGDLTQRFRALSKDRFAEARKFMKSLPDLTKISENDLTKLGQITKSFQQYYPDDTILTASAQEVITKILLTDQNAVSFLQRAGLLNSVLKQWEMYYRVTLRGFVNQSWNERAFRSLERNFTQLKETFPLYHWADADKFAAEYLMLRDQRVHLAHASPVSLPEIRHNFEKVIQLRERYPGFWPDAEQLFARKFQRALFNYFRHAEMESYTGRIGILPDRHIYVKFVSKDVGYDYREKNSFSTYYLERLKQEVESLATHFPPNWAELEKTLPARKLAFSRDMDTMLSQFKAQAKPISSGESSIAASELSGPTKMETTQPKAASVSPERNENSSPAVNTGNMQQPAGNDIPAADLKELAQKISAEAKVFFTRLKKWFTKHNE